MKSGKMACGKNYFMSLQKIGLIVTIFRPVILSKEGEMAGQDTCCCCVTCHISFAFRRLACKYTLFCTQQKKSEAGIMLILSDGSICGTVNLASDRVGWLHAIQQMHPPLLFWSNQYVYITTNIGVCHGTN